MYHNMLGAGVLFLISSTSMRARDYPTRSGCDMFYMTLTEQEQVTRVRQDDSHVICSALWQ